MARAIRFGRLKIFTCSEVSEAASRYPVVHRAVPIAKRSIPIHANVLGSAQLRDTPPPGNLSRRRRVRSPRVFLPLRPTRTSKRMLHSSPGVDSLKYAVGQQEQAIATCRAWNACVWASSRHASLLLQEISRKSFLILQSFFFCYGSRYFQVPLVSSVAHGSPSKGPPPSHH